MKPKFIKYFMDVAELTAQLSPAVRLKVGSVIVKDTRIISCGYNALPEQYPSDIKCEVPIKISEFDYFTLPKEEQSRYTKSNNGYAGIDTSGYYYVGLKTVDDVIHSEANSISRLASSNESGIGAILFCTHSPCLQCSKIIYSSGIKTVYYKHEYRNTEGLDFLKKCNIEVIKYND